MSGVKKALPLMTSENQRQCTWVDNRGVRCNKKAKGHFFCLEHFILAGKVESCSYCEYEQKVVGLKLIVAR